MIANIRLQNFRSYLDQSFEFDPGVNIIVGPNASGKTNLLEAILVISKGKSYRVKDSDLVQFNKDWSRLDCFLNDGTKRVLKINLLDPSKKQYEINDKKYKRMTINNSLATVLFEPNHLQLLSGGPERRRDYLDELLEQITPGYAKLRRQYSRVLVQRNALLKQPNLINNKLFPWNIKLSELGGKINRTRNDLIDELNKKITNTYKDLSDSKKKINIIYEGSATNYSYESTILNGLEKNIDTDKLRGFTSFGPHREDFVITMDGHPVKDVASRGESRTLLLVLKIMESDIIELFLNTQPILLLDDVFSELDGKRRHLLTTYFKSSQMFLTTTDADIIGKTFASSANTIAIT